MPHIYLLSYLSTYSGSLFNHSLAIGLLYMHKPLLYGHSQNNTETQRIEIWHLVQCGLTDMWSIHNSSHYGTSGIGNQFID